jgi:hypothetical protein
MQNGTDTNNAIYAAKRVAKMKSTGTIEAGTGLWYAPNTDATNSSGFTGLPGGYRSNNGTFNLIGYNGYWWEFYGVRYLRCLEPRPVLRRWQRRQGLPLKQMAFLFVASGIDNLSI